MIDHKHLIVLAVLIIPTSAKADDPPTRNTSAARALKSVAEIIAEHDRALMRDLADYLKRNPKADDVEQGYMTLFNKAIDHDWFAETAAIARSYLAAHPDGAVKALAQIIVAMANGHAGQFAEAVATFQELLRDLDKPEQEEFAINFADALAGVAAAAGAYGAARQVYEAVLHRFQDSPNLRQKVRDDLARLDKVGQPAPAFAVNDLAGKPIRLADFKGQFVLIDFWATWCGPCVADLPNLQAAYAKYHGRGFEIISVSLDETAGPVADFVKARKIPWRQIHNASCGDDLVEAFGIRSIPASFLIDPDGKITRLELRGATIEKTLGTLLK
jgi:peroxiredoxin/predicted negative regulator of RcsB-dependent stress response